jgi:hypothetical protein
LTLVTRRLPLPVTLKIGMISKKMLDLLAVEPHRLASASSVWYYCNSIRICDFPSDFPDHPSLSSVYLWLSICLRFTHNHGVKFVRSMFYRQLSYPTERAPTMIYDECRQERSSHCCYRVSSSYVYATHQHHSKFKRPLPVSLEDSGDEQT